MIVLVITLPIRPDKREELLAGVPELVAAANQADGVNLYLPATTVADPNTGVIVAEYESEEARNSLVENNEVVKQALASLPDFLAGEPEFRIYEVSNLTVRSEA